MKVRLYDSERPQDRNLLNALYTGFVSCGCSVEVHKLSSYRTPADAPELTVFIGERGENKRPFKAIRGWGKQVLLVERGYFNPTRYYRLALNYAQPYYLIDARYSPQRLETLGVRLENAWNRAARAVLLVEPSEEYLAFHDLPRAYTKVVRETIEREIERKGLNLHVDVHPESARHYVRLQDYLCVVSYGSNLSVEAVRLGIPTVSLGTDFSDPVYCISLRKPADAVDPCCPLHSQRLRYLSALAWCQFSLAEIAGGFAWDTVSEWLLQRRKAEA